MKKINILELIHGNHFGGAEKVVLQIATYVNREEFHPIVICLADGILYRKLKEAGVETYLIPMKNKIDFTVLPKIIKLVKEKQVDVIHSHTSRTNFLGRVTSKFTGARHIATIQSPIVRDVNDGLQQHTSNAFIERVTSPLSSHFVCVSQSGKEVLLKQHINEEKVSVIYNGAEVKKSTFTKEELQNLRKEFGFSEDDYIVSMVASLRPRKGPEFFIQAIPIIKRNVPNSKFLVVGSAEFVESKDYLLELKSLAESLDILVDKDLIFTGFRDDTDAILEISDVVVLPSLFGEGLPLTLLEAMAHKTAIVTTDTEGNNEAVQNGVNGFLVPPRDYTAIAQKVTYLLQNDDIRNAFANKGYELAHSIFSMSKMINEYEEQFRRLSPSR